MCQQPARGSCVGSWQVRYAPCKAACSYGPGLFCLGFCARMGRDESPPPPAFGGREVPCGVGARPWLGEDPWIGVVARPVWCGTPRYSSTAL